MDTELSMEVFISVNQLLVEMSGTHVRERKDIKTYFYANDYK